MKERMKYFPVMLPPSLLEKVRAKAGNIPVSVIIRRLLEKYVSGEVGLD